MTQAALSAHIVQDLKRVFAGRIQEGVSLAPYTSSGVGGAADFLLIVRSSDELAEAAKALWAMQAPFRILGGGSNVLVADRGMREVVILNRARDVRLEEGAHGLRMHAESGAALNVVARRAAGRGWTGLEWAVGIPGTVGGAVVGNAGAHGSDVAGCLDMAVILQRNGAMERWAPERLGFAYRDSWLKRNPGQAVVLAAEFALQPSTPEAVEARMKEILAERRQRQPAGASWGSIFKNPEAQSAGRLIDQAGLKGLRRGKIEISPQHGNFLINLGGGKATDAWALIQMMKREVASKSGVDLQLEIELVGDWEEGHGTEELGTGGRH
jgi:UDP-N-acetylmuramate dehydrogenase